MPAVYTHYLIAREHFKALPKDVQAKLTPHLTLYFFGAQGPDFCFFYPCLQPKHNLGSFLHRKGSLGAFRVMKAFAEGSDEMLAYALGFLTHYAADVRFHPYIYAASKKSLLKHSRIENALDRYWKENAPNPYREYFKTKLTGAEKSELFLLYAAIAAKSGQAPLIKSHFCRAISLFNAYLPMPNAFFGGERDWGDCPIGNTQQDKNFADSLFLSAVAFSVALSERFLDGIKHGAPLSVEWFGKNLLTGE